MYYIYIKKLLCIDYSRLHTGVTSGPRLLNEYCQRGTMQPLSLSTYYYDRLFRQTDQIRGTSVVTVTTIVLS